MFLDKEVPSEGNKIGIESSPPYNFSPVDQLVHCRKSRLLRKYSASENSLCILCADVTTEELSGL